MRIGGELEDNAAFSSWSPYGDSQPTDSNEVDGTSVEIPYQSSGSALFAEGESLADELGWDSVSTMMERIRY